MPITPPRGVRIPASADPSKALPRGSQPDAPWWVGAIGYQVYLRSFRDASGDGIGDLAGLRQGLGHLADLGVDAVWITPFYDSPQVDYGYDVSDHRRVHPDYGTLEDLDAVVADAHRLGLRVVIDLVPNHTSDQHPWFLEASSSREAATRDHYVWRDPAPDGGPPNNWVSKFGGPAWTWHEPTGQYYLHSFLPEQPDLNWRNPEVRADFEQLLRFWLDRGIDGFRVDAAHYLLKDPALRDNPALRPSTEAGDPEAVFDAFEHRYDLDQPDVIDIFRAWRGIAASYDAVLIGEVVLPETHRVHRYTVGALHLAFHFPALKVRWDADEIRRALAEPLELSPEGAFAWPLSSHDDPRVAERFGGGAAGARRAVAYLMLLAGLPGMPFVFQGDELGLDHGVLPASSHRDPLAVRNPGVAGRDGSRTPVPWSPSGPGLGFTTGVPWLPFPSGRTADDTVEAQRAAPRTTLATTRRLLHSRRRLPDLTGREPVRWLTADGPVVAYQRNRTVVAVNVSSEPAPLVLDAASVELAFATSPDASVTDRCVSLPADGGVIAVLSPSRAEEHPSSTSGPTGP